MKTFFTVLTLETDISKSMAMIDEMHRNSNQFTSEEIQQQLLIRRHLAEAAAVTRMLVGSVLARAQSRDVHELVEAVESAHLAGSAGSGRDPGDENDAVLRMGAQSQA